MGDNAYLLTQIKAEADVTGTPELHFLASRAVNSILQAVLLRHSEIYLQSIHLTIATLL